MNVFLRLGPQQSGNRQDDDYNMDSQQHEGIARNCDHEQTAAVIQCPPPEPDPTRMIEQQPDSNKNDHNNHFSLQAALDDDSTMTEFFHDDTKTDFDNSLINKNKDDAGHD